jgi:hypothetical protein
MSKPNFSKKFLGGFGLGLRKQYFDCAQFDKVAQVMEVPMREKNRYEFRRKYGTASFRLFSHMIVFDKDWFGALSPKTRCAVLAHELWHSKTRRNTVVGGLLITSFMPIGWPIVAGIIAYIIAQALTLPYLFAISWLLLLLYFETYGMRFLFKRLLWPVESQSDAAAVRYFGADPTREYLNTKKNKGPRFWSTHPPVELRLRQAEELRLRYQQPVIDFDSLEEGTPQEFIAS